MAKSGDRSISGGTGCFPDDAQYRQIAAQAFGRAAQESSLDSTSNYGAQANTGNRVRKRKQELVQQVSTYTWKPEVKRTKTVTCGRCLICYSIISKGDLANTQKKLTWAALMELIKFQGCSNPEHAELINKLSDSPYNSLCHICNSICEEISSKQIIIRKLQEEILELQKKSLNAIKLSSAVEAKDSIVARRSRGRIPAIEGHLKTVRAVRECLLDDGMINEEKSAEETDAKEQVKSESGDESLIDWESKCEAPEKAEESSAEGPHSLPPAVDLPDDIDDPLTENNKRPFAADSRCDLELGERTPPSTDDKYKCSEEEIPPSPTSSNSGSLSQLEVAMSSDESPSSDDDDEYEDEVPLSEDELDDEEIETVTLKDKLDKDEHLPASNKIESEESEPSQKEDPLKTSSEPIKPENKSRWYDKQKCDICGKILANKQNLQLHKLSTHGQARPHECPHCGMMFKLKPALSVHMRRKHNEGKRYYVCHPNCSENFSDHSTFQQHLSEIHDEYKTDLDLYHCVLCWKSFVDTEAYQRHWKTHRPKKKDPPRKSHTCHICSETFVSRRRLQTHLLRKHNETDSIKTFECGVCKKKFVDKASCKYHEKLHDPNCEKFECEHCGKMCYSKYVLNTHMKLHSLDKPLACQMCPESFARSDQLKRHQFNNHRESITFKTYECGDCRKNFLINSELTKHRESSHKPREGKPVCVKCGYRCDKEHALRTHISKDCGNKAVVKNNWKEENGRLYFRDMEVRKDAESKYECPIDSCRTNFKYNLKKSLHEHIRNCHRDIYYSSNESSIDEKKHQCDHCGSKFMTYGLLLQHIKGRHEGGFSCDICGVTRTSQAAVNYHKRVDHQGIRPHVCEHCGKAYGNKSDLIIHVRHHTGERPYKCDLCPKAFINHNNLRDHQRTHHSEMELPAKRKKSAKSKKIDNAGVN